MDDKELSKIACDAFYGEDPSHGSDLMIRYSQGKITELEFIQEAARRLVERLAAPVAIEPAAYGNMNARIGAAQRALFLASEKAAADKYQENFYDLTPLYSAAQMEQAKAQEESELGALKLDLIACRGSVKTDLNMYERLLLTKEKHDEQGTPMYLAAVEEVQRLFGLLNKIDAIAAITKEGETKHD